MNLPEFQDLDLSIARARIALSLIAMLSLYVDPSTAGGLFHLNAYALTTLLCRRLLGDRNIRLTGAELIVEWGAAKWLSSREPRDRETARWAATYQMRLVRRVPAASFSPPPRSDAAYLRIRPRCRARAG